LGGATAHVVVSFSGLNFLEHPKYNSTRMVSLFATELATACKVDKRAVLDLYGDNASVALTETGTLEAYVVLDENSSVNAIASSLYSASFEKSMKDATARALGSTPQLFKVNAQPRVFRPLSKPTLPAVTTTTATATVTLTTTCTKEVVEAVARSSFPAWAWVLLILTMIGGLGGLGVLCFGRTKKLSLLGGRHQATRRAAALEAESEDDDDDEEEPVLPVASEEPAAIGNEQRSPPVEMQPTSPHLLSRALLSKAVVSPSLQPRTILAPSPVLVRMPSGHVMMQSQV